MAKSQGVSKSTINNIWRAHNLKPHRVETFKLSRDPKFLDKMIDVVGLYLNPPQQAIVLCVDEKSQIQALPRGAHRHSVIGMASIAQPVESNSADCARQGAAHVTRNYPTELRALRR